MCLNLYDICYSSLPCDLVFLRGWVFVFFVMFFQWYIIYVNLIDIMGFLVDNSTTAIENSQQNLHLYSYMYITSIVISSTVITSCMVL